MNLKSKLLHIIKDELQFNHAIFTFSFTLTDDYESFLIYASIFLLKGFAHGGNGDVACDAYHKYKVNNKTKLLPV
jgi:hypothetical protein